jgi:16S rRNA (guanine1207-N2)-methyltransferase
MSSGHYFDPEPSSRSHEREVTLVLPDVSLQFRTDSGVFAAERVDAGTKLLLLEGPAPDPSSGPLLDLGCGYGPIAITLAKRCPDATVWAVDVNERARELCRLNAAANGVDRQIRVARPDEVDPALQFGQIWSNPPIRIGKPAMHDLLSTWLGRLSPQGSAHLVVSRHLGADSLSTWLTGQGMRVERRRSRMGYRLLDVWPAVPNT